MTIEPVYGNGWTNGRGNVTEPRPFEIVGQRTQNGVIFGQITLSQDESLLGATFKATPRHANADGVYNCQVVYLCGDTITGFCKIG